MTHALAASPPPHVSPAAHVVHGTGTPVAQVYPTAHGDAHAAAGRRAPHMTPPAQPVHVAAVAVLEPAGQ